ncbi:hypothetical protein [Streptomyces tagetis]|uniref:Uncharacterized protein n=1 Tax=Streptomyces tagetis TaxID=2820809 RepID=A0A940XFR5_9ACTN|nr:hypothetical protein [Streptomyces sp. RG38]MBQ0826642.1 hypothetical protein [Streptomyces sp. RG38]
MTAHVPTPHDWLLTAPWWHWPRQGVPPAHTRPALQKYATPALVDEFLADPQRRLVFDDVADQGPAPSGGVRFVAAAAAQVRKLYLATHHRHYLVAVELHCDRPGLPSPRRDEVCEAGFVVRRRRASVPPGAAAEARRMLRDLALARARLGAVDKRLAQALRAGGTKLSRCGGLLEQHATAERKVDTHRSALHTWAEAAGVERALDGWRPLCVDAAGGVVPLPERPCAALRPLPGLGRWERVSELPHEVTEATFPLYPLVPDPADEAHDGARRTLYFGVVPTGTLDLALLPVAGAAPSGEPPADRVPRFDDVSVYEIRCYVRRHDPACPRRPGQRDCHGPLTWSEPSEPFRLAGPLDPRGTANRPVTIRMPDKAELRAAVGLGAGIGGVRVGSPPDMQFDPVPGGGYQICSFSIPLITIIATFVLRLFLPVVVLLFGLWFLLALKICIPPSLSVDADLQAELAAKPVDFEADADFEARFGAKADAALDAFAKAVGASATNAGIKPPKMGDFGSGLKGQPTTERFRIARSVVGGAHALSAPDDDLRYEPRVEREEVFTA